MASDEDGEGDVDKGDIHVTAVGAMNKAQDAIFKSSSISISFQLTVST